MEKMPVFFLAFCGAHDRLPGNDAFRIVALNTKFTHMKKLFLAFTAFVGMLTGLSLTSCGGGGGGTNLAGTTFHMGKYKIILNEQVEGIQDFYDADITDASGDHYTETCISLFDVVMENGKLKSAKGNVSSACFSDSSYGEIFVKMFWSGLSDVTVNMIYASPNSTDAPTGDGGSMFTITAGSGNSVTIDWHFADMPIWKGTINGTAGNYWLIPSYPVVDEENAEDLNNNMIDNPNGESSQTHYGYVIY